MAGTLICHVVKRLSSSFTLDVSLDIPLDRAPVTVLFGPSASGKTTLLRILAGLEAPDEASILFRGRRLDHLTPQQRRIGYLFQDHALFPHLTVAANVGFAAPRDRARRAMETFGILPLAGRRPGSLSGGEKQRVALARAIAAGPDLLLLDEPLSALDSPTRARMRQELRGLLSATGIPAIVVTHDRSEALALGDWMAVMAGGRVRQTGTVQDVFARPADPDVAAGVGVENVLPAVIEGRQTGLLTVRAGDVCLQCVDSGETGAVLACVRAEDVAITREIAQSTVRNRIAARVRTILPEGPLTRVELDCGFPLVALVTTQSAIDLQLAAGDAVGAIIKTTSVHLIPHA